MVKDSYTIDAKLVILSSEGSYMNWDVALITQSSNSRGRRTPAPIKTACVWCSCYNEELFPSLDSSLSWQTSILMSQWPCILSLSHPLTRDFVFQMCKDLWHLLYGVPLSSARSLSVWCKATLKNVRFCSCGLISSQVEAFFNITRLLI